MTASTPLGMTSLHLCVKHPVVATCTAAAIGCYAIFGGNDTRMVAITFDDGFASDYVVAAPELASRGMKATSFINPIQVDQEGRVSVDQLRELQTSGWEIGSHGMQHEDLTLLPKEEVLYDIIDAVVWFAVNDFGTIKSFATPFGAFNDDVLASIGKHHTIHANAWSEQNGINTRHSINPMNVHREDFNNTNVDSVCQKLDSMGDNTLYVILFHEIVQSESGNWKTNQTDFLSVLDCIEQKGFKTVTVTEGVEFLIDGKDALQ